MPMTRYTPPDVGPAQKYPTERRPVVISAKIEADINAQVAHVANRLGMSKSQLISEALKKFLNEHGEGSKWSEVNWVIDSYESWKFHNWLVSMILLRAPQHADKLMRVMTTHTASRGNPRSNPAFRAEDVTALWKVCAEVLEHAGFDVGEVEFGMKPVVKTTEHLGN